MLRWLLILVGIVMTGVESSIYMSKSIENIYMYRKDKLTLDIEDYLRGTGEDIKMTTDNEILQLEDEFKLDETATQKNLLKGSKKLKNIHHKALLLTNDNQLEYDGSTLTVSSNDYDCHELAISEELNLIVVGCYMYAKNKLKLVMYKVNNSKLVEIASQIDDKGDELEITGPQDKVGIRIESISGRLLVYKVASGGYSSYKLYLIGDTTLQYRATLTLNKNINLSIEKEELCSIMDTRISNETIHDMCLYCLSNKFVYYVRCKMNADGASLTCLRESVFQDSYQGEYDRTDSIMVGRDNNLVYYLMRNSVVLVDFKYGVMKALYKSKQIAAGDGKQMIVKRIANNRIYYVYKNLPKKSIDVTISSIYRNYSITLNLLPSLPADGTDYFVSFIYDNVSFGRSVGLFLYDSSRGMLLRFDENVMCGLNFRMFDNPLGYSSASDPHFELPIQLAVNNQTTSINLNIILGHQDTAYIDMPSSLVFYKNTKLPIELPLAKQAIQGFNIRPGVTSLNGKYEVRYVGESLMLSASDDQSALSQTVGYTVPEGFKYLDSCKYNVGKLEFVLLQNLQPAGGALIMVYSSTNNIFNISCNEKPVLGRINYGFGKIKAHIVVFNESLNAYDMKALSFEVEKYQSAGQFKRINNLVIGNCPRVMKCSIPGLPYIYLVNDCGNDVSVIEFTVENDDILSYAARMFPLSSVGRSTQNYWIYPFEKNIFYVDAETVSITGFDRVTEVKSRTRYYPIKEYGIVSILTSACLNCTNSIPICTVVGLTEKNVPKAISYHVEESADNGLRRVHSVIELPEVPSKIQLDSDPGVEYFALKLYNEKNATIRVYNMSIVPKIFLNSLSGDKDTLKVVIDGSRIISNDDDANTTSIEFIDQSFEDNTEMVGRVPYLTEREYSLEDQLKFDGVYLNSKLKFDDLEKAGIVSFKPRSVKLNVADEKFGIPNDSRATNIIIEKNIVLGWNDNEIVLYEDGQKRFRLEGIKLVCANFAQYPYYRPEGFKDVIAIADTGEERTSNLVVIWKNNTSEWTYSIIKLDMKITYLKGVRDHNYEIGIIGYEKATNKIFAGFLSLSLLDQEFTLNGVPANYFVTDSIEAMDGFMFNNRLIGVVKKRFNEIGSVYEFELNPISQRVVLMNKIDVKLFPTINNQFRNATLKCATQPSESTKMTEAVCFLYNNAVYSYANKIVLRGDTLDSDHGPTVSFLGSFVNMQGYECRKIVTWYNYTLMVLAKTSSNARFEYLIQVYKHDYFQTSPYITLTPDMLDMKDVTLASIDATLYTKNEVDVRLMVFAKKSNQQVVLQSYAIGPMRMLVRENADQKWSSSHQLEVEYMGRDGTFKRIIELTSILGSQNESMSTFTKFLFWLLCITVILATTGLLLLAASYISKKVKSYSSEHPKEQVEKNYYNNSFLDEPLAK